jgi:DNA-directed RNA polymerase I subunit RPA1
VKVLETYGVETCRSTIIREIKAVFGAYFITVDYRHLALIADYMTFNGGYRPFNRTGIVENPSPAIKMSFETTMNFILDASIQKKMEDARSASASIILGHPAKVGTGCFDVLQDLTPRPSKKGAARD